MTVLMVGFFQGNRPDVERWTLDALGRLPAASTIVLLLDTAAETPASSVVFPRRQVDFTQAIKRGARIVFVAGPHFSNGYKSALVAWLGHEPQFSLERVPSLEIRSLVPALQRWFDDQRAHATLVLDPALTNPALTKISKCSAKPRCLTGR